MSKLYKIALFDLKITKRSKKAKKHKKGLANVN